MPLMLTSPQKRALGRLHPTRLPAALAATLAANHMRVLDLFRALDTDDAGQITRKQLRKMLTELNMAVSSKELVRSLLAHTQLSGTLHSMRRRVSCTTRSTPISVVLFTFETCRRRCTRRLVALPRLASDLFPCSLTAVVAKMTPGLR